MFSSDAPSSIAYGPEQVVLVLASLFSTCWSGGVFPSAFLSLLTHISLTIFIDNHPCPTPQGGGASIWLLEKTSPELGLIAGEVYLLTTC